MTTVFRPEGLSADTVGPAVVVGSVDHRLSRTNYFDGRLLVADDLIRDQVYFDQRLLEMGLALGAGCSTPDSFALTLQEDGAVIAVGPGSGITKDGRALALHESVSADLTDFAALVKLNGGTNLRFKSGVYAVCLRAAERLEGVAEAFPLDLGSKRAAQPSYVEETVEVVLVRLPLTVVGSSGLTGQDLDARAHLASVLWGTPNAEAWLPEDVLPLGLVGIEDEHAAWVDSRLLRATRRPPGALGGRQMDLAQHYEALYAELAPQHPDGFAARDHFYLLPPFGSVPKANVDPVSGTQSFFPETYDVTIAPVRLDDVPSLQREAMAAPPLDLEDENLDASILILVPLDASTFGRVIPLFDPPATATTKRTLTDDAIAKALTLSQWRSPYLRRLDGDVLRRVFDVRPATALDTQSSVWNQIWPGVSKVLFARRAPRAAEVGVGGIVMATGYHTPAVAKTPTSPVIGSQPVSPVLVAPTDVPAPIARVVDSPDPGAIVEVTDVKRPAAPKPARPARRRKTGGRKPR
jgi:hypothetical protein